ncbi:MAG TPA: CHASE3 domain-containing protein [Candidatus Acidoferrales bacterium]|nr:CHASE3 domain-containing protein [Candidatus Acidoferrales bacterium]
MIPTQKTKRTLFWIGLSLPMLALIAMTWLVHQAGGQFNNSFNWVLQNYKVLDKFEQMQAHIVDAEANQRGFLLTGKREYLEPYHAAMTDIDNDMADLKKLTQGDPVQQANIGALEQLIASNLIFDPATAFSSGQFQTNASVITLTARGKQKIEALRRVLFQAREEQEQALSKHQQSAEEEVVSGQVMSLVLIVAVAVALVFVVMILLRLEKLQQFVTVCAWTGQVKFHGEWVRLDQFLERQFGISVSHSLSNDAAEKMMREIEDLKRPGGERPSEPPPLTRAD